MTSHPIQPLETDDKGVLRFKANAIVQHLLDAGPFDMNKLALMAFSREDREQFAQLIGYSHSGAGDLGYMSIEVLDAAWRMHQPPGESELEARLAIATDMLTALRESMRAPIAELYGIHPDDLRG